LSLTAFAGHIASVRECLKAVRTREEKLGELRRDRRSVISKVDSADKKLNKMSPEDRNFQQQRGILMSLREEIRTLGTKILDEEASFGDWKRVKSKEWMVVLFSGLLECSAKGAVVATSGGAVVECVPVDAVTQPGLPRAQYSGHSQVELLMVEAEDMLCKISSAGEAGASFVNEANVSFVGEVDVSDVGNGTPQPPNGLHTGDVPGNSPPSPSSPTEPHASSAPLNNHLIPDHQPGPPVEREPHRASFVGEICDGSPQLPSGSRIGDTPGLLPPAVDPPDQTAPTSPPPPYASPVLPDSPFATFDDLNDLDEYNPHSQSQAQTPRHQTWVSPFDRALDSPRLPPSSSSSAIRPAQAHRLTRNPTTSEQQFRLDVELAKQLQYADDGDDMYADSMQDTDWCVAGRPSFPYRDFDRCSPGCRLTWRPMRVHWFVAFVVGMGRWITDHRL